MYYVAFLHRFRKNIVVPVNWIMNYTAQWKKFVNRGLNQTQRHRIFYTEDPCAFDENGALLLNFQPNFDLDAVEFPNEGCYDGKLVKFFSKLCQIHLNLYYFKFCFINNISNENVDENVDENHSSDLIDTSASTSVNGQPSGQPNEDTANRFDENSQSELHSIEQVFLEVATEEDQKVDVACGKELVPVLIIGPTTSNTIALNNLINEPTFEVVEVGDIVFTVNTKTGFAKPFETTTEGLIKRENDMVSGNIPFNISVRVFKRIF